MRQWIEQAISRISGGNSDPAKTLESFRRPLRIIATGLAVTASAAVAVTLVVSLYDFSRPPPQKTASSLQSGSAAPVETEKTSGEQKSNGQATQSDNQAPAPIVRVVVASPYVRETTAPLNASSRKGPTDTTQLAHFETSRNNSGSVPRRSAVTEENAAPVEVEKEKAEPVAEISPEPSEELSQESPEESGLRESRIASAVNLRARPHNHANVLTVIPTDAVIMAQANCEHWCNVVYDGQQGYIYKTFIRR